jgi:hypothetical protein
MRIILRHMMPSFLSHIIASLTLAIPGIILAETGLSFIGLGLRAPAISWGVLLQEAQNLRSVALAPWVLTPAFAVIITVLTFNFLAMASAMQRIHTRSKPFDRRQEWQQCLSLYSAACKSLEAHRGCRAGSQGAEDPLFLQQGIVRAVENVDFTVLRGQTLGVVGESGCGKSVMARSVMSIVPSRAGSWKGRFSSIARAIRMPAAPKK